jgi:hypothetical protein
MTQIEYASSDPLGIAAVDLIRALAQSHKEALEPNSKRRARPKP